MDRKSNAVGVTVIMSPKQIQYYCPYCQRDIVCDFDEMSLLQPNGDDWSFWETLDCPDCNQELEINYIDSEEERK